MTEYQRFVLMLRRLHPDWLQQDMQASDYLAWLLAGQAIRRAQQETCHG